MSLERMIYDEPLLNEQLVQVSGSTQTKVNIKVFEVFNIVVQTSSPKTKIWYTIKASSNSTATIGSIQSKRIACGDGQFDTSHDMLVDTSITQVLVLKVKYLSAILGRKVTVGTYTISLQASPKLNESVKLQDRKGNAVGDLRISVAVSATSYPSLLYAPRLFRQHNDNVIARPFSTRTRDGEAADVHTVSYFQLPGCRTSSVKVQGPFGCWVAREHAEQQRWTISEKVGAATGQRLAQGQELELEWEGREGGDERSAPGPMEFKLRQNGGPGRSRLALVRGNALESGSGGWGVWTLVRKKEEQSPSNHDDDDDDEEEEEEEKGASLERVEFLALIHLAGPSIEVRDAHNAAVALAVGNAMFCACAKHPPARRRILRLLHRLRHAPLTLSTPHATSRHGRGFTVLAHDDTQLDLGRAGYLTEWMEMRMRLAGVGKDRQSEEQSVIAFACRETDVTAGRDGVVSGLVSGAMVARELDWGGGTLLGIPVP